MDAAQFARGLVARSEVLATSPSAKDNGKGERYTDGHAQLFGKDAAQ